MVLQRRLDYGFSGYQVPVVPRASRSARGRGPVRRKCEKKRAFEILASVAGELLLEGESSASTAATAFGKDQCNVVTNPVQWEQVNRGRFLKVDPSVGESYEKTFACMPELRGHCHGYMSTEFLNAQENFSSEGSLASDHFGCSETLYVTEKLVGASHKNAGASPCSMVSGDSTHAWKVSEGKVDGAIERKPEAKLLHIRSLESGTLPAKDSLEDAMELDPSSPGRACEESNLKASLFRDCIGLHPVSTHHADIKVVNRDGAENSIGCSQNGTMVRTYRPLSYAGDQRIRNLSTSRHWSVAPNLKSRGYFRNEWKTKPIFRNRGTYCSYQRSQKIFPFKKRKFFDQSPLSTSDGALHCEDIFNSSDKSTIGDNLDPATEASSSVAGQQVSLASRGCNVKLSIKSFKVPELLIEIPTTATVGLLKRTVMEAVSGILGDGLHVGVLLQGKKVRDDNKTLLQTGISEDDQHGNLGFVLEPRHAKMMPPPYGKNLPNLSGNESGRLARHTTSLMLRPGKFCAFPVSPEINFGSSIRSDLGAGCSLARTLADDDTSASRALVAVPAIGIDALSVVPLNSKSANPEFGQRRIRRPFSVSEVEALVQAVEKLGTGRWRDVKLRAFDKANHRTYVDLKDKWKTLVHTARISPQQRRGEPVPQELLDRVLAAHAYWSYRQARQLVKAEV